MAMDLELEDIDESRLVPKMGGLPPLHFPVQLAELTAALEPFQALLNAPRPRHS